MTKHTVHLYREMRLRFDDVEAESPEQAAQIARDMPFEDAGDCDDCEGETLAALVDVAGDDEHKHSVMIDFEPGRLLGAGPKLLAALQRAVDVYGQPGGPREAPTKPGAWLAQACEAIQAATAGKQRS